MNFSSLDNALSTLVSKLDEMYSLVASMIDSSLDDPDTTFRTENRVNSLEIEIDEIVVRTIALYNPEASPLREILMALKINNDMERIADHAENVARDVKALSDENLNELWEDIKLIKDLARRAFVEVYSSFKNKDAKLAEEICKSDHIVDSLRDKILEKSVKTLPTPVALKVVNIAQNFERIGDLSTNIAEDVIFIVEGKIIKHGYPER